MDGASEPSYVHGASPVALLGETIGQNLDRTAARVPDNEALVSVHQDVRTDLRPVPRGGRGGRPRPCWRSGSSPATGSASGRPTAPSG